jgi:hypothetical protein
MKYAVEMVSGDMMYIESSMTIGCGLEAALLLSAITKRTVMLVLLIEGIYEIYSYNGFMWNYIYPRRLVLALGQYYGFASEFKEVHCGCR